MAADDLHERIRNRVITSLYSGHLEAGDRLPSVRRLGKELDADPRAVLRVYRSLEEEGLVDIRTRSGVYLAEQRQVAPNMGRETSEWVASQVLTEAWRRRIPLPELPELLRRCMASVRLRCACVDEVEDVRVALCHELEEDFGLQPVPMPFPRDTSFPTPSCESVLEAVDLIACTTFHAPAVREIARRLGKRLVVVSANPVAPEQIAGAGGSGDLTFVVVDPRFGPRLREAFGQGTLVRTLDEFDPGSPAGRRVVYTRAAADRSGDLDAMRRVPTVPVLSPETVRDLCHWIVRMNLDKGD